jgi:Predicted esterase of the alpha-beta hydrolase superfamily
MKIPMFVVATALKEGKRVVFNYGNTGQAVRASVSIPSMFIPTVIQKKICGWRAGQSGAGQSSS